MFRLGLQHGEVETQLHQRDLMMMGRVRTGREGQPMAIHNREDFDAFAALREPHRVAAALGGRKCRVDEAFSLVDRAVFAQGIPQLRENVAQDFAFAPLPGPINVAQEQHENAL